MGVDLQGFAKEAEHCSIDGAADARARKHEVVQAAVDSGLGKSGMAEATSARRDGINIQHQVAA